MPCERMVSFGFVYLSTEVGWGKCETNTIEEIEFERLRMEESERRNKNYYSNFELFRVSSVFSCSRVHTFDLHVSVKKCSLLLPRRNSNDILSHYSPIHKVQVPNCERLLRLSSSPSQKFQAAKKGTHVERVWELAEMGNEYNFPAKFYARNTFK